MPDSVSLLLDTWKDKILDYEIETPCFAFCFGSPPLTWKDKILDYEIETEPTVPDFWRVYELEKIRFSITRLKLPNATEHRADFAALKR